MKKFKRLGAPNHFRNLLFRNETFCGYTRCRDDGGYVCDFLVDKSYRRKKCFMNTNITYKSTQDFQPNELQDLFLSVEWSSGNHSEKLVIAMKNSSTIFTAWDGGKLIGL